MFSPELNQLIESSLTDGVLTEKERAVIKKRALLEGVDPDEVEVILESKLQELQQKAEQAMAKVRKCPACGAIVTYMQTTCPQCGAEISHTTSKSITTLFEEIKNIQNEKKTLAGILSDDKESRIISLIKGFPVPSGKGDLLEFIISMQARWKNTSNDDSNLKNAYKAKYDESIKKARILFPTDPQFQSLFADSEKHNSIKYKLTHPTEGLIILYLLLGMLLMAGIGFLIVGK